MNNVIINPLMNKEKKSKESRKSLIRRFISRNLTD